MNPIVRNIWYWANEFLGILKLLVYICYGRCNTIKSLMFKQINNLVSLKAEDK